MRPFLLLQIYVRQGRTETVWANERVNELSDKIFATGSAGFFLSFSLSHSANSFSYFFSIGSKSMLYMCMCGKKSRTAMQASRQHTVLWDRTLQKPFFGLFSRKHGRRTEVRKGNNLFVRSVRSLCGHRQETPRAMTAKKQANERTKQRQGRQKSLTRVGSECERVLPREFGGKRSTPEDWAAETRDARLLESFVLKARSIHSNEELFFCVFRCSPPRNFTTNRR